jgi:membrane-bound inhibitor of C-type lysozyme
VILRAVTLALVAAQPLAAETQITTTRYTCDRGVMVPATYVTADDTAIVVLHVDGNQIMLYQEIAASGARYGWPSGGSNYVWWSKGDGATLFWKTPEAETPLLTCTTVS